MPFLSMKAPGNRGLFFVLMQAATGASRGFFCVLAQCLFD